MSDNRKALNERFQAVFGLLEVRGDIAKGKRGKSKSAFAERLGVKLAVLNRWLVGEYDITYEAAKRLCEVCGVSETYLFHGQGEPFGQRRPPNSEAKLCMALGIDFSPNILFTNVEGFASNTVGVELLEENSHFHIPGIEGDLVAFYINGNSMAPTIAAGDMVICAPLDNPRDLKDNEVYAVVSNQCVWVKRVQKCYNKRGEWSHLRLISDNASEYDPFIVENQEALKILRVVRRLTGLN